ncbi:hypothetical protein [Marinitoga lauensis]|uniref:hypothetical protein n=1 Tax=Marinitoga lauensis TaxID=2201189 RepID=UPI00197FCC66|nr:hypothetical protein [Marinitoga lauensis]
MTTSPGLKFNKNKSFKIAGDYVTSYFKNLFISFFKVPIPSPVFEDTGKYKYSPYFLPLTAIWRF